MVPTLQAYTAPDILALLVGEIAALLAPAIRLG
jgi:hypothetical protein